MTAGAPREGAILLIFCFLFFFFLNERAGQGLAGRGQRGQAGRAGGARGGTRGGALTIIDGNISHFDNSIQN